MHLSARELASLLRAAETETGFLLRLRENDPAFTCDVPGDGMDRARLLRAMRASASQIIDAKLLRIEFAVRPNGEVVIVARAGDHCGFASVSDTSGRLLVEVTPKVSAVTVLHLVALSGNVNANMLPLPAEVGTQESDTLPELVATAFAQALRRLLGSSGLRALHSRQDADLRFKIRGRVRIAAYLRNVASGRSEEIPCSFETLTVDNYVNRVLRSAIRLLIRTLPSNSLGATELGRIDSLFRGVRADASVSDAELLKLSRVPDSFSQYVASGALPLAQLIVRSLMLTPSPGHILTSAVSFAAYQLFEDAFAAEMSRRSGLPKPSIAQRSWEIRAQSLHGDVRGGSSFQPDVVLPPNAQLAGLVADTKWKTSLSGGSASMRGSGFHVADIQLLNEDIFQVLAYMEAARRLHRDAPFVGALVYPVADVPAEALAPIELSVSGTQNLRLPIFLVPWDVGRNCSARSVLLWQHLQRIRAHVESTADH